MVVQPRDHLPALGTPALPRRTVVALSEAVRGGRERVAPDLGADGGLCRRSEWTGGLVAASSLSKAVPASLASCSLSKLFLAPWPRAPLLGNFVA